MQKDFNDFTQDKYKELLQIAKSLNNFIFYDEITLFDRFILWRHDVDFSMEYALKLARIEYNENVKSTFFLHSHNHFYNLLDDKSFAIVKEIISLGHQIGIHFDTHYYNIKNEEDIEVCLLKEKKLFMDILEIEPRVFSFHNTDTFILSCKKSMYGGLINTYSQFFQDNVKYCSDSNGYWRHLPIKDLLKQNYDKLQILTHPGWWQEKPDTPYNRICNIVNNKCKQILLDYEKTLEKFNRINIK
ncbi:MAG: hypothetical protein ACK4K9_05560 [Bacteroidia bacterium]